MSALMGQPDYQGVPTDVSLEAYLHALPRVQALDEVARRGDLALIDIANLGAAIYPNSADGLVLVNVLPHKRKLTLMALILGGAVLGDDWFFRHHIDEAADR